MKHIRNSLVIKDVYSITVFQQTRNRYHLNVTGIKSLEEVKQTLLWLEEVYCRKELFDFISYNVDNITSTFNLARNISLHNLASTFPGISYNPEWFHALYMKTRKGTVVAFQSGKINSLGCKSLDDILQLWSLVKWKLNAVYLKVTS